MTDQREFTRRQRVLSEFGDFVLDHDDLDAILNEGCRLIADALHADLAKVVEIDRDSNTGLVRAGFGWAPGIVGHERIDLSDRSSEAFAIRKTEPVITNDIGCEERFEFPPFLVDHGVVALMNVPIILPGRHPWGILQVDAREPRDFAREDVEFLKTYSMVLGPVIDRLQAVAGREEALRNLSNREDRLRRVLDGMGEAFGLLAPDFTILEHNRRALRLDGLSREDSVGRSHWEVYPGSEQAAIGQLLKKAMTERVPVSLEHLYTLRGDSPRWLEMRAYPAADGALAVFWRDVTDRRQAADALRESEARYRALFESMDEAYAVVEVLKRGADRWADFRFVEVNPAFIEHTSMPWPVGKTSTELLGTPNPRWTQLYGQALDTNRPLRVEEVEPTLGRTFDLNIFSLDKEKNRVAVLFTNITERKKTESALRQSEEGLRAIMESALDYAIFTTDQAGIIEAWSPGAEAVFGWTAEEASGQELTITFTPEDRKLGVPEQEMAEARDRGVAPNVRWHVRKDGERVFIEGSTRPLRGGGSEPRGFLKVGQDVTARRKWEERQNVLLAELQHRTRNLMAVVQSMFDKTRRGSSTIDELAATYKDRMKALARVQGLLSRLSDTDRIAFDELIRTELSAMGAVDAAGHGERVVLDGPEGVRLRSSTVQTFALAIHELATNAAKYGALAQPDGRLTVRWRLTGADSAPRLRIEWIESGVDIPDPDSAAKGAGYGRELIERALPYQLQAKTSYVLDGDGVRCTIELPVSISSHVQEREDA